MESYGKWMGGDCFQNTQMPEISIYMKHHSMVWILSLTVLRLNRLLSRKKEAKKPSAKAQLATKEEYEVLEREEYEIDGETLCLEKRRYAVEGSMAQLQVDNVGASTCWKGYKARRALRRRVVRLVPNCVKAGDEVTHEGEELEEAKRGLYANIHAKRKRGEAPAKTRQRRTILLS